MSSHSRSKYRRILAASLLTVLLCGCTASQNNVVEVFDDEGTTLGRVAIQATCSAEANDHIRRGLALLHNMTYVEAAAEFEKASDADSGCPLARWGQAMTLFHPLWPDVPTDEQMTRGLELITEAREAGPNPLEAAYLSAAESYFQDANARTEAERISSYAGGWDEVVSEYPDDVEARLFQSLSRIATSSLAADPGTARAAAGEIAESVLGDIPDHPGALHYTIHAYDTPQLASRGEDRGKSLWQGCAGELACTPHDIAYLHANRIVAGVH